MFIKKIMLALVIFAVVSHLSASSLGYATTEFHRIDKLLKNVNSQQKSNTYAILEGYIEHIRNNNREIEEYPISMGIVITQVKTITQIIVNKSEGYMISKNDTGSSIVPMHQEYSFAKKSLLENMGVNPNDLAMGFLNYKLVNERFDNQKIRMIDCMVLLLEDDKEKEVVKLFMAGDYLFPLKAEFYNNMQDYRDNKINRTLEVSSFKKKNDLYYVSKFNIYGAGWRTIIEFDKAEVDLYNVDDNRKIFKALEK